MNGWEVMTLRLILGHATLDVTQMYMHLTESHIKIQHQVQSGGQAQDTLVVGLTNLCPSSGRPIGYAEGIPAGLAQ